MLCDSLRQSDCGPTSRSRVFKASLLSSCDVRCPESCPMLESSSVPHPCDSDAHTHTHTSIVCESTGLVACARTLCIVYLSARCTRTVLHSACVREAEPKKAKAVLPVPSLTPPVWLAGPTPPGSWGWTPPWGDKFWISVSTLMATSVSCHLPK